MIRTVVIDDAEDLRYLLCMALTRDARFEVVGEAADGAAGLSVIDEQMPDLLLLDLAMPIMDGLEVLAELQDRTSRPRTVVLSGFTNEEMVERAMALGATTYIPKGGSIRELPDLLVQAVEMSR